eukprot:TRINITY_DN4957_c0_g1_i1.p1 TRINITY_DN4957_c0_g1~~TRINITY_DN4957_c0_g1_i1.p1  ORF type:complete len:609 (-),score=105.51 TRINITY_DN4957_c0_g1_i1:136-1962(-)
MIEGEKKKEGSTLRTVAELDSLATGELRQWFKEFKGGGYHNDKFIEELERQDLNGEQLSMLSPGILMKYLGEFKGDAFCNELKLKGSFSSPPMGRRNTQPKPSPSLNSTGVPDNRSVEARLLAVEENLRNIRISKTTITATTAVEFYKVNEDQGMITTHEPWFSRINQIPTTMWDDKQPHPFFEFPPTGVAEREDVQPYWNTAVQRIETERKKELKIILTDENNRPSFGTRKPDIVGWKKLNGDIISKSSFDICVIGELKGVRHGDFTSSEKGKLLLFLENFLRIQTFRTEVTGFLSDGVQIQFFRALKQPNRIVYHQTKSYVLSHGNDGVHWLFGLLTTEPSALGLTRDVKVGDDPVLMKEVLGTGGSSLVFAGEYKGTRIVVKCFHHKDHLENERAILDKIAGIPSLNGLTPTVVGVSQDELTLLLTPVGLPFVTYQDEIPLSDDLKGKKIWATKDHFIQLIDILERLHKDLEMVHRDLKLDNWFSQENSGPVFLNDWGSAALIGKSTSFTGCLELAPEDVLQAVIDKKEYTPQPAHDLQMVVKCVWASSHLRYKLPRDHDIITRAGQLITFWTLRLSPPAWKEMIGFAQNCQYEKVKRCIARILE